MMKKIMILLAVLAISLTLNARGMNAGAIKLGLYAPSATEAGFIIGGEYGRKIDEALDVCFSFDMFHKEFDDNKAYKDTTAFDGNVQFNDLEKLAQTTVYDFPLMVSLTAKFPINNRLKWFLTGGFGAEMLYASYYRLVDNNDKSPKEETGFAFDWNWRIGAGALYQLGSYSEIFLEFTYHISEPSYEYKLKGKTYERIYDMNGILSRVGVRYYL